MGAEEEGETQLNLLNGVQNVVGNLVGDFVRGQLGKDTIEKTVLEVKKVLPSLHHFKVVSSLKVLKLYNCVYCLHVLVCFVSRTER